MHKRPSADRSGAALSCGKVDEAGEEIHQARRGPEVIEKDYSTGVVAPSRTLNEVGKVLLCVPARQKEVGQDQDLVGNQGGCVDRRLEVGVAELEERRDRRQLETRGEGGGHLTVGCVRGLTPAAMRDEDHRWGGVGGVGARHGGNLAVMSEESVGVGPHPEPWPEDPRLDPELLVAGDRRNVADRYRYWRVESIIEDLDLRRHPFHVAIENWAHDRNIGTVVRTANAFLAAEVHIVGRRRWNRRGAMVTDRYQRIRHHETIEDLLSWAAGTDLPLVGVDNLPGSEPIEQAVLPREVVLVFGQEGPGLSPAAREAVSRTLSIAQFGSTRSINAGVAAGIAMHSWVRAHADVVAWQGGDTVS